MLLRLLNQLFLFICAVLLQLPHFFPSLFFFFSNLCNILTAGYAIMCRNHEPALWYLLYPSRVQPPGVSTDAKIYGGPEEKTQLQKQEGCAVVFFFLSLCFLFLQSCFFLLQLCLVCSCVLWFVVVFLLFTVVFSFWDCDWHFRAAVKNTPSRFSSKWKRTDFLTLIRISK